jgi:transglutaminase-like putative cysteine protease
MKTSVYLAMLGFLSFVSSALANGADYTPVPDWVDQTGIEMQASDSDDHSSKGIAYILYDKQVRLEEDGYSTFRRYKLQVVARPGLESAGTVNLSYDPSEDSVVFHHLHRIRNGQVSDLSDTEFLSIRRETEIEAGILDGTLTLHATIADLQVGDVLDFAWSVRSKPSVFKSHYLEWVTEKPSALSRMERFRLLVPEGRTISIEGPAKPDVRISDGWTDYRWEHRDKVRPDYSDDTERWEDVFGETQVVTDTQWEDVLADLGQSYLPGNLPSDLLDRIASLPRGDTQFMATQAFRMVQDEIRYFGTEIGAGGYLPRTPETVWSRKFGDCKDKSILLVSILKELGITSDVVLVHSSNGRNLPSYVPSPYLFNHAIVRVFDGEETFFLDPTDVLQGGIGSKVTTSDFFWGLPVSQGEAELVSIAKYSPPAPEYEVHDRYEFKSDDDYAAELFVKTTFRGKEADWFRYKLARDGLADRAESYLEYYEGRFPGAVSLTPLYYTDDKDANLLVTTEHYGLPNAGFEEKRYWEKFYLNPYATKGELEELPDEELKTPYYLEPLFKKHHIELVGDLRIDPPKPLQIESQHIRYSRVGNQIENGISATYEIEVVADSVQPDEADEYRASFDEQDDQADWRYKLTAPGSLQDPLQVEVIEGWRMEQVALIFSFLFVSALVTVGVLRGMRSERADTV